MNWDTRLDTCLQYYLERERITQECANAWQCAKEAYDMGNAMLWIEARHKALQHHAPTGDCMSAKIEWSFNRVSVMDMSQLKKGQHEKTPFGRACMMEIKKRQFRH